jgi:IclR family acetate operon transcriptional repressor
MTGHREPVGRALEALAWMADHPKTPWGIRQVARDMNTSPTTVHRIFGIFEGRGLLQKDGNGGYLPSIDLYRVCRSIGGQDLPVRIARPLLDALANESDQTVMLGAYDARRQQMMYVDVRRRHHAVPHIGRVNRWRPIHAGAPGLAILAFLRQAERDEVYRQGLDPMTDRTVVDVDTLEELLAHVRELGFAHTRGQHTVGTVGFGAPVFDAAGNVYGDVCIALPEQRFSDQLVQPLGEMAKTTASAISGRLKTAGYRRVLA